MLELWDIVIIFGLVLVCFLIGIRLLVAVMKRLLPQMVPELMKTVGSNMPNISLKQGLGLFFVEFVNAGGMEMLVQKLMGALGSPSIPPQGALPPRQPPILPGGGQ